MVTAFSTEEFAATRLGVVLRADPGEPAAAWGVTNPGGARAPDGTMHLFPRLIAEGNYSRIGHARVRYEGEAPAGVERLGFALEPQEPYERSTCGGGVEDPRVVYVPSIQRYVMTYTAFVPFEPRVAIAVSSDLIAWRRLGLVRFEATAGVPDLNACGNKDAAFFAEVVADPAGVPSLAMLHRPTTRIRIRSAGVEVNEPPSGETHENIWISYVPLADVLAGIANLTSFRRHERLLAPEQPWEQRKIGTGTPPVRLPYGWLLPYHAVSAPDGRVRYCMGVAILDLERPSRVLYRTPLPVLEPETDYERNGLVADVIFPTAGDLRSDGRLDVYYGAADRVVAAARLTLPSRLPPAGRK